MELVFFVWTKGTESVVLVMEEFLELLREGSEFEDEDMAAAWTAESKSIMSVTLFSSLSVPPSLMLVVCTSVEIV